MRDICSESAVCSSLLSARLPGGPETIEHSSLIRVRAAQHSLQLSQLPRTPARRQARDSSNGVPSKARGILCCFTLTGNSHGTHH